MVIHPKFNVVGTLTGRSEAGVFRVGVHSFAVGDIVEKHYNGKWNYWTTIHDQMDAEAAVAMASSFFRIVRGVRKDVIL